MVLCGAVHQLILEHAQTVSKPHDDVGAVLRRGLPYQIKRRFCRMPRWEVVDGLRNLCEPLAGRHVVNRPEGAFLVPALIFLVHMGGLWYNVYK